MFSWQIRLAIRRRETLLAFGIMLGLAVLAFCLSMADALRNQNDLNTILPAYASFMMHSSIVHPVGYITLMIIPLLSSLAFSDSWFCERQSGLSNVILTRYPMKKYIWYKAIVSFIIGGLVVAIPVALNLIWCMIAFPANSPRSYIGGISSLPMYDYFWRNIYLNNEYTSHPYVYAWCSVIGVHVYGGISSLVSYSISLFIRKWRVMIMAASFLLINIGSIVQHLLSVTGVLESGRAALSSYFLMAEDSIKCSFAVFVFVCLAVCVVSSVLIATQAKARDQL